MQYQDPISCSYPSGISLKLVEEMGADASIVVTVGSFEKCFM